MAPRTALFAICMMWLAHEAHYSPAFFMSTVRGSISDIIAGLDAAMAGEYEHHPMLTAAKAQGGLTARMD
ncbi:MULTISPECIES: hypothetical protein [Rhodomicrobium]|uniref:hypothetical protein n=1 Tax=Rhodomicrobium TaxID=1068 RepID=UPI000B4A7159|nr:MULTISPECIES: hypothetical protein [Rhodomicrobium]